MGLIVVTGGAGFIGSNLVAGLEARGDDVVVCDALGAGEKWRNIAKRKLADIVAPDRLLGWLDRHRESVEAVVHLGAISSTVALDADQVIENNFRLSLALFEWCRGRARLIYASSAATYGDGGQGFDDDESDAALARLRPLNLYGWSKHVFDRRVASELRRPGSSLVGLKFFNVYGPNEYHKDDQRSVVQQVFERAVAGEAARLFRSHRQDYDHGGQLRDFIWVEDCVKVMLWLLDRHDVHGLFNLGTGQARSFADLARAVFAALGREALIDYVDMPEALRARYQYFTQARMTRLRAAGYDAPFASLEDGVAAYVRGYLASADRYR